MAEFPRRAEPPPEPSARVLELSGDGLRRRFLLVVPEAQVNARRDRRLAELGLDRPDTQSEWSAAVRERIATTALADACEHVGAQALGALLRTRGLRPAGTPRLVTLAGPPDGDLILRAEFWTLPEVIPPDPAALRITCLVARPDATEEDRALAALAAMRAVRRELPPGAGAAPGDEVVCDIAARLLPPENRIPQPGLAGAMPGAPGRLPDGWSFGDNGAGLAAEVLEVAAEADPPYIRLRVHGTAKADGQSFVIFHPARTIAATAGGSWVGSVMLRPVGEPIGLRGSKLRLESQPTSGEGSLRRKDAALTLRGSGFARCYVSDRLIEAETALLRMPLLFDHAAGPVDFRADIALPRLVEGLDLGQEQLVPLPEFSGRARRFTLGGPPDPAGLAPHLAGIAAGEAREIRLTLPQALEDRAIAGHAALFAVRATAVLRHAPPPLDDALAQAMGFPDLGALRGSVARHVAQRHAALARRQARRAVEDALIAAAGEIALPPDVVRAEFATLWPRLAAAAQQRAAAPPEQEAVMALAARQLRARLLLAAIAERHGLNALDADMRTAEAEADRTGGAPPDDALRARALEEAAMRFVLGAAQVTRREVSVEELAAAAG
ncbi:hypothetical protein [Falsiroseomonas sp.]|uniref:hypothetical protein n=1 Tax=Falsiroseomonas sp. TaxID=2870721 RepID=UPI003562CAE9